MIASPLSFQDRADFSLHPIAKKLFLLMSKKQSNLALSADVTRAEDLLSLANTLGPEICVLKTHIDIIEDFTPKLTASLKELANSHQFLLFEDRKFADIGNTVQLQFSKGIYHIAEWADIINAHSLPGDGIIQGLKAAKSLAGLLLLAEMSSKGHLMDDTYQQATLAMAKRHPEMVIGFVTQHAFINEPRWIYFTPGIKLENGLDGLGQQYVTPIEAIVHRKTDIVIVGRDIIQDKNPLQKAKQYREVCWEAYQSRFR